MKRLNHGFHVDFVLVILKCDLLYYLHLHFCSDFVVVLSELKLVHCQDYIVFLCQNQTCLILCCFIHVLLCYCVCHVACIYQVLSPLVRTVLFKPSLIFFQIFTCNEWFLAFYNTGRFSTMMILESKYVVEVFYSKC